MPLRESKDKTGQLYQDLARFFSPVQSAVRVLMLTLPVSACSRF